MSLLEQLASLHHSQSNPNYQFLSLGQPPVSASLSNQKVNTNPTTTLASDQENRCKHLFKIKHLLTKKIRQIYYCFFVKLEATIKQQKQLRKDNNRIQQGLLVLENSLFIIQDKRFYNIQNIRKTAFANIKNVIGHALMGEQNSLNRNKEQVQKFYAILNQVIVRACWKRLRYNMQAGQKLQIFWNILSQKTLQSIRQVELFNKIRLYVELENTMISTLTCGQHFTLLNLAGIKPLSAFCYPITVEQVHEVEDQSQFYQFRQRCLSKKQKAPMTLTRLNTSQINYLGEDFVDNVQMFIEFEVFKRISQTTAHFQSYSQAFSNFSPQQQTKVENQKFKYTSSLSLGMSKISSEDKTDRNQCDKSAKDVKIREILKCAQKVSHPIKTLTNLHKKRSQVYNVSAFEEFDQKEQMRTPEQKKYQTKYNSKKIRKENNCLSASKINRKVTPRLKNVISKDTSQETLRKNVLKDSNSTKRKNLERTMLCNRSKSNLFMCRSQLNSPKKQPLQPKGQASFQNYKSTQIQVNGQVQKKRLIVSLKVRKVDSKKNNLQPSKKRNSYFQGQKSKQNRKINQQPHHRHNHSAILEVVPKSKHQRWTLLSNVFTKQKIRNKNDALVIKTSLLEQRRVKKEQTRVFNQPSFQQEESKSFRSPLRTKKQLTEDQKIKSLSTKKILRQITVNNSFLCYL